MTGVACVDIGSTWTKAALVDVPGGRLLATAQAPTTLDDVVAGVLSATAGWDAPVLACSSAGGGLRLAVVGYEELISAEAGHRAALSAGARVVHVAAGRLDRAVLARLRAAAPDVVLLVGGTDGGEASVLRHNAAALAALRWPVPVVLAGNAAVREEVAATLAGGGVPVTVAGNVLPDIGRLEPASARAAIRAVFLRHVIGGDRLSTDPRLAGWVRTVTPDAVLAGVTELAAARSGRPAPGVVVVDVGGATTDVHCVPDPDAEQAALGREAVGVPAARRTVEGDLGVASSAGALRAAAAAEDVPLGGDAPLDLGAAAVTVALRRHLRGEAAYGPGGAGVRTCGLVVLSGGVFRHASGSALADAVARVAADRGGAGAVLEGAALVVDRRYVLAAAGLLAGEHPGAAAGLLADLGEEVGGAGVSGAPGHPPTVPRPPR
ncbi:glutamate mutase L [Geodermatophilus marinus]|uniref:glutamate mutase L n=1 Tax=Geodermatophilus sp. LHW52908 TaxID=2303986 RepID=UPI000E3EBA9B|nr:glutamate mutase L [Geodermatophilus sp. LHW52908]RFU21423.1 glutamate mutase [Geodermatophilus sp. LHW52908]